MEAALPPSPPGDVTPRGSADLAFAVALTVLQGALFITVSATAQTLHLPFGMWFSEVFVLLGTSWIALRATGRDPLAYPRAGVPGGRALWMAVLAAVLNYFAVVAPLQIAVHTLAPSSWSERWDQSQIFDNLLPVEFGLVMGAVGIAAPICEEYFFRGILQRGLMSSALGNVRAIVISALVFAVFHLNPLAFPSLFALGLLFGYLYVRTGSLWPSIVAHAAHNLVSPAIAFSLAPEGDPASTLADSPEWWQLLGLVGLFAPLLWMTLRWFQARSPIVSSETARPLPPFRPREALAWLLAGVAAIALLLAFDHRGVQLNLAELRNRLPRLTAHPSPELKQAHEELFALRNKVRRGEKPLDDYVEALRQVRALHAEQPSKDLEPELPTPVPPTPKE